MEVRWPEEPRPVALHRSRSPRPQSARCERYSFEEMASDVRAFVDALDLGRFSLGAHSMGAVLHGSLPPVPLIGSSDL